MVLRIICLWLLSLNALAIDKGHFEHISEKEMEQYILPTFRGAPAYYLNYKGGGPLTMHISKYYLLAPLVSVPHDTAAVLFLNRQNAEDFILRMGEDFAKNYEIKTTGAHSIIKQLHKNANRKGDEPDNLQDVILLATLKKDSASFQYHIDNATGQKLTIFFEEHPLILERTQAMQFHQKGVVESYVIDRFNATFPRSLTSWLQQNEEITEDVYTVSVDDRQFLDFIIANGKQNLLTSISVRSSRRHETED